MWCAPVSEYADITAVELEHLYADGAIDPVAVWRSVRERMDAWEPVVHATSHRDDATSESEARAAARRWRTGRQRGPLDGVPVTVKENIATEGIPTPLGTAAAELVPATADAPVVARRREPGAVIVAKTTMPDYGMLTSGVSSLHPTTRNPWNPAWTPGGSSAGAAAAGAGGGGARAIWRGHGGIRARSHRHGHGWVGAAARLLDGSRRLQAELRAGPGGTAVLRKGRRAADAHRRRRRASDDRPQPGRRPRPHEPAAGISGMGRARGGGDRAAHRPRHERRRRDARRPRHHRRRRERRRRARTRGRGRRARRVADHRRDARRPRPLLADAQLPRLDPPPARAKRPRAGVPSRVDGARGRLQRHRGLRRLQPDGREVRRRARCHGGAGRTRLARLARRRV